jgi:hypothetical protein
VEAHSTRIRNPPSYAGPHRPLYEGTRIRHPIKAHHPQAEIPAKSLTNSDHGEVFVEQTLWQAELSGPCLDEPGIDVPPHKDGDDVDDAEGQDAHFEGKAPHREALPGGLAEPELRLWRRVLQRIADDFQECAVPRCVFWTVIRRYGERRHPYLH